MVARVTKLRETEDPTPETAVHHAQRKRPEAGRYLLQIDRQTKSSYLTIELAEAAGMIVKAGYPLVQVSVYDSVECRNTIVDCLSDVDKQPAQGAPPGERSATKEPAG